MTEIYQAGYIAECTFRLDLGMIREAMEELVKRREASPPEKPFLLGVGSIISPRELEIAIDLGFDLIVAPCNVMGSFGAGTEFVRLTRAAGVFSAPAIMTPTELGYFLEAEEELKPNAIKVFPAGIHGGKGISALLAPFAREKHRDFIIMPTGGVTYQTGPEYQQGIKSRGFFPVLGMSSPLELVKKEGKPGEKEVVRKSLLEFKKNFRSLV
jgi:2-keto-3-deoxy-6-phosphogluconate aldolase